MQSASESPCVRILWSVRTSIDVEDWSRNVVWFLEMLAHGPNKSLSVLAARADPWLLLRLPEKPLQP
jgi:hypothetical protein